MSQSSHWIAEVGGGDQHCRELSIPNLLLFMSRIGDWTGFYLVSFPDPGSPPAKVSGGSQQHPWASFNIHSLPVVHNCQALTNYAN